MALQGRRLLREWLDRSKQQQKELAHTLGVSDAYLSQILSGLRRPKLELLIAIEAQTGVPVASWVDTRRGKADQAQKRSA